MTYGSPAPGRKAAKSRKRKKGKLIVNLEHDSDAEDPNDQDGWKIYSFNHRHNHFKHPRELGMGPLDKFGEPKIENPGLRKKLAHGLAFVLSYFEHGKCIWFLKGEAPAGVEFQWDGTRIAGLLVWEWKASDIGAKTLEDRAKDAASFLERYTSWCNGEVYYFSIKEENGELLDSGDGVTDVVHMFKEIYDVVGDREVEFKGEARDLALYCARKCDAISSS